MPIDITISSSNHKRWALALAALGVVLVHATPDEHWRMAAMGAGFIVCAILLRRKTLGGQAVPGSMTPGDWGCWAASALVLGACAIWFLVLGWAVLAIPVESFANPAQTLYEAFTKKGLPAPTIVWTAATAYLSLVSAMGTLEKFEYFELRAPTKPVSCVGSVS